MSTTHNTPAWWIVARREVEAKLRDRTFLIGTVVTVLLIAGFMAVMALMDGGPDDYTVAASGDDVAMADAVASGAEAVDDGVRVEVSDVPDAAAAESALAEGEVHAWLQSTDSGWVLTQDSQEDPDLTAVVQTIVGQIVLEQNASEAGTSLADLQAGSQVSTELLSGDAEQAMVAEFVGFAFIFLFYLAAMIFGYQLAYSVIEEKQSRIVEIIAAAIPLRQLLAGKVVGNTILAFLQMALYVGVGLIGMAFTPYRSYIGDVSGPVVWFLGFFVAGFVALACLWAVAGSLASRNEDVQATGTPLMILIMGIFFGATLLEGRGEVIGSFVPPLSAVLMPKRMMTGDAAWWEAVAALGLLALFTAVTVWFGERLYRRSLLQTGGKLSMREAWSTPD